MGEGDSISEATLRNLIASGAVRSVAVVGQGPDWAVQVEVGMRRWALRSAREPVRLWRSLDRLARWLRERGVAEWTVDARHYNPGQRPV